MSTMAPNILFIFTDQQSAGALSCAGNAHLHTPHMDALASSGVRFEQSYCAAPVCGPSRASVATGRLPHEHGALVNDLAPDPAIPSFGEVFRDAGYSTAWSGKWDMRAIRGFDGLHDADAPLGLGIRADAHVTDRAVDFLARKHDRPFFLGVSLTNPHDICYWIMQRSTPAGELTPETIRLKQAADGIQFDLPEGQDGLPPLPPNFEIDPEEPGFIRKCRRRPYYGQEGTFTHDWNVDTWRAYLHAYYRLTERVDVQVGRLLDALREAGLEEDTLVLFTSDHGEGMAAHRWVAKLMLYEEPSKVPFIVSWPGRIPAGRVDGDHLVSGLDVFPTLCDWAGVSCPEVTGTSLRPLVEDPEPPGRPFLVSELHPDYEDLDMQARMVRTPRHKYVAFSEGSTPEMLFDLEQDPGETRNLAREPEAGASLDQHRARLRQWCAQTGDAFALPHVE